MELIHKRKYIQKILRSSKQLTCTGKCIHGNNRFRPIIWYYRGHRLIESTFFSDRLIPIYFSSILRWLKSAENLKYSWTNSSHSIFNCICACVQL